MPDGFVPAGHKVRAVCRCGYRTTPRVNADRALRALPEDHGWTRPVCALCDRERPCRDPAGQFVDLEVHADDDAEFLLCATECGTCARLADARPHDLDVVAWGDENAWGPAAPAPRPQLRLVR